MFYINYLSIRIYSLIYRNRYITGWIELLSYSQQISMGSVAYSGIIKRDKVFALWELKFWWRRWKIRQCLCNKVSLLIHTEKEMATHSSVLAWRIPGTAEPGGLQSMGSLRVGHDWAASPSLFTFMHWRRKWQPTPVFLPGESQGRGSLVGCRLWGRTESDTTEAT